MQNPSAQNISILDFEAKFADEVLRIQAETGLSVWSKSDYLSESGRADSIFKIARNTDEQVVGFALVRLLSNGSNNSFDSAEILNIAVGRSFQKQGVGQKIFNEILSALKQKDVAEIWLEVRESNAEAIAFYQKTGFKKQFERKNYYRNSTENALVFRLADI